MPTASAREAGNAWHFLGKVWDFWRQRSRRLRPPHATRYFHGRSNNIHTAQLTVAHLSAEAGLHDVASTDETWRRVPTENFISRKKRLARHRFLLPQILDKNTTIMARLAASLACN